MSPRVAQLRAIARGEIGDPLVVNPWLVLMTMVLTAGFGALFWLNAARLHPAAVVGIAGSLIATGEALATFGDLGMNVALTRILPVSDRRAADIAHGVGVVLIGSAAIATGYVLVLPFVSPRLSGVLSAPWSVVFVLLVAATSVNHLTDNLFLAINRVAVNLVINGFVVGLLKVGLPFLVVGAGALGLYASYGTASVVGALVSLYALAKFVPGRVRRRSSVHMRQARRFAGAGYAASVLQLAPQLVLPLLIINVLGAEANGRYFVGFQVVTLLNALVIAIGNSMYAEGSRRPHEVVSIVRRAGRMLAFSTVIGAFGLAAVSPLVLGLFGHDYATYGTDNLRILALGSLGVALNYWSAIRLRLTGHKAAMMGVQLFTTTLMLTMALLLVHRGIEWVALSSGIAQLTGGVVGYVVSCTLAPLVDAPAELGPPSLDPPTRSRGL